MIHQAIRRLANIFLRLHRFQHLQLKYMLNLYRYGDYNIELLPHVRHLQYQIALDSLYCYGNPDYYSRQVSECYG